MVRDATLCVLLYLLIIDMTASPLLYRQHRLLEQVATYIELYIDEAKPASSTAGPSLIPPKRIPLPVSYTHVPSASGFLPIPYNYTT